MHFENQYKKLKKMYNGEGGGSNTQRKNVG